MSIFIGGYTILENCGGVIRDSFFKGGVETFIFNQYILFTSWIFMFIMYYQLGTKMVVIMYSVLFGDY